MTHSLTEIFDEVYIVNLPERTDRREEMALELQKVNLTLADKAVTLFPAIKPTQKDEFPSIGAKGCFLSHLNILREARAKQPKAILFMEDDLAISPELQKFVPELAALLNQHNWSICYLGHVENIEPTTTINLIPYTQNVMTTHFYAVNGNIVDRLIAFLEAVLTRPGGHPDGGPMHYDGALSTFRRQNPDILTLIAQPNLGWQRSSRSDVAETKWFDKIPGLRFLVVKIRKLKNWLKAKSGN
jgi:hypothetical protein